MTEYKHWSIAVTIAQILERIGTRDEIVEYALSGDATASTLTAIDSEIAREVALIEMLHGPKGAKAEAAYKHIGMLTVLRGECVDG